jgi:hypothetical protein
MCFSETSSANLGHETRYMQAFKNHYMAFSVRRRLRFCQLMSMVICLALTHAEIAAGAQASKAGCPATTIEIRREMVGERQLNIHCRPIKDLSTSEIATLDPAAIDRLSVDDRATLEHKSSGLPVFPSVDQSIYVTPEWADYARQQQRQLIARRSFLMRQLANLQGRSVEFTDAIQTNDELSREVIADDMVHTLTVIGALAQALAAEGGIPTEDAVRLKILVVAAQTELNARAVVSARTVPTDKVIEVGKGIKNLLLAYPGLPISTAEREALARGTDALFKFAKIGQRWADGQPFDLKGFAAAADDAVDALTSVPTFNGGKAVRSTVQMAMAQYALGRIERDQADLQNAYRNHMAAEEFLNDRIAQTDLWLSVYRKSLGNQ